MTKNDVGEIRLRRIIFRDEKYIALELRTPHDKEWGFNTIYPVRKTDKGIDAVADVIEEKLNECLFQGYKLVCCRNHEWERGDEAQQRE